MKYIPFKQLRRMYRRRRERINEIMITLELLPLVILAVAWILL